MANKLFLQEHSVKAPRNGFDHSSTRLFSTPVGYLNPIMCKELVQGDYVEESISSLTRTHRLNTAAFARLTEHFDCFFVPTRLLLSNFATWKTQLSSLSVVVPGSDILSKQIPSFTFENFVIHYYDWLSNSGSQYSPDFVSRVFRIFSLLRTGIDVFLNESGFMDNSFLDQARSRNYTSWSFQSFAKTPISLLPFVAYNRIYSDFYSDSRWEVVNPTHGNLDWLWHNSLDVFDYVTYTFISLKSSNFKRDMFLGLSPTQQYGSTAVVDILSSDLSIMTGQQASARVPLNFTPNSSPDSEGKLTITNDNIPVSIHSQLNMLSLRYAQALQRYKEAIGSNLRHLSNQMEAQFGVKLPEMLSQSVEYIDSVYNQISINEVVATADGTSESGSSSVGQIGGRGFGFQSADKKIKYTAKEDGFFFVIYHIDPDTIYDSYGIDKQLLHLERDDFYNPSFDNIGLAPIYSWQLDNEASRSDNPVIGYGSRYMEYKTDVDLCFGSFTRKGVNSVYSPHYDSYEQGWDFEQQWTYNNFKISPTCTDYLFFDNYNGSQPTDPFDVCVHHDLKLVRNMYVDTLSF